MSQEKKSVLVIDDDPIARKIVRRYLESDFAVAAAKDGEEGLVMACESPPDVILLDLEMPGMNGYEVCEHVRGDPALADIPVVFLSAHGSLRERLQGYEAGADDYLVKPFEAEALKARISVLIRYREQQRELKAQYELAQKTAYSAMTGSSELGQAMQFVEKSYNYRTFDDLAHGFFEFTDWLGLSCSLRFHTYNDNVWFSSSGAIKPLEQQLMSMADQSQRFVDFGSRTIINFPSVTLLAKNMPLDDLDRYGRVKDLLPVLLAAINSKMGALNAEYRLRDQVTESAGSFQQIKSSFVALVRSLAENQHRSTEVMRSMFLDLNHNLPGMGLDDDQEEYILHRIDSAIEEVSSVMSMGEEIRGTFTTVVRNLQRVIDAQEMLMDEFAAAQAANDAAHENDYAMDVELF